MAFITSLFPVLSGGPSMALELTSWLRAACLCVVGGLSTQAAEPFYEAPDLVAMLAERDMGLVVQRYRTDLGALRRWWDAPLAAARREQERAFFEVWMSGLQAMDYDAMTLDDSIDWQLLRNRVGYEQRRLELSATEWEQVAELLPFAEDIHRLHESRRALRPVDAEQTASQLSEMASQVKALAERVTRMEESSEAGEAVESEHEGEGEALETTPLLANRAASHVRSLARTLKSWNTYRSGYDPLFTWWCAQPVEALDKALGSYAKHLRETVAGVKEGDTDTILGDPIGSVALRAELQRELIPYSAEELLEIAEREFAWCQERMLEASRELGFGDDWRAAQEHVKGLHVAPGEQPELIRQLAYEAVDFLESHELLTVPSFAKNVWRMEMMSPARQKYTPYFTGGEVISVAFPTDGMEHADKLMSMRGNNIHFSRATVHHELIPGHHLQGFMTQRHKTHRQLFNTPFWGEGWALYWEMLLWDEGFARGPEDQIGMLFWRKHRCARILFSLGFHLGRLSPDECIDLLMDRVGHERANATAEVRRSVQGGYGPLYQAAYMLGGLQFRALHAELVGSGKMSNRDFHDAVLRQGSIPVEMVRAAVTGQAPARDFQTEWRFDG